MLRHLFRAYLIDRMLRGSHSRRRYGGYRYGRRPRSRTGFFGPFPYHSRRTRGGSRVAVSGCCLPIPLGMLALAAAGLRLSARGARARRRGPSRGR